MADDVTIQIGANLERLKNALEEVAALFGVAFTVDAVKTFVNDMAELGSQIEKTAATLGVSNQAVVELSGFAKLTGTSIESLSLGIERMSLNVQRASRDSFNPMAQALNVLHLNAKDLIGVPADKWFEVLTEAASRFNPSLNLTNALMLIGGRQMAQMAGTLILAGANFGEFRRKIDEASDGLARNASGMADTDVKLKVLGISFESLGARIFGALKPLFDQLIETVTRFVQSIDEETIRDKTVAIGRYMIEVGRDIALMGVELKRVFDELKDYLPELLGGIAALAVVTGQWSIAAAAAAPAVISLIHSVAGAHTEVGAAADKSRAAVNAFFDDAQSRLKTLGPATTDFAGRWAGLFDPAKLEAFRNQQQEMFAELAKYLGENAGRVNFEAEKEAADAKRLADLKFESFKLGLDSEVKTFQITEQQKTALLIVELDKRKAAEIAAGENRDIAQAKENLEIQRLNKETTDKMVADWKGVADKFASDFSSALDQVLSKQKSFGAAMGEMFGKMIEQMIAELVKLVAEYILLNAVAKSGLIPGYGGASFPALAGGFGGLLGGGAQSAAQTANTTALGLNTSAITTLATGLGFNTAATTTNTAGGAANSLSTAANTGATVAQTGSNLTLLGGVLTLTTGVFSLASAVITQTVQLVAQFIANIGAVIANTTALIINTAAKIFIPAEQGLWDVGSMAKFPSYQSGSLGVPRTQFALLHAGEMVIPAGPAQQMRESVGVAGGQPNVSLNINAADARSFANMMMNNRAFVNQLIGLLARNNPANALRLASGV